MAASKSKNADGADNNFLSIFRETMMWMHNMNETDAKLNKIVKAINENMKVT